MIISDIFKLVDEAYKVLMNPEQRKVYDSALPKIPKIKKK
jgi:curved DNA-binding protein CbpA